MSKNNKSISSKRFLVHIDERSHFFFTYISMRGNNMNQILKSS